MTRRHLILMVIGCLVPIVGLAAIFLFQVQISTVLLFGLFLLCPALHLWMMHDHIANSPQALDPSTAPGTDNTDGQQAAAIKE